MSSTTSTISSNGMRARWFASSIDFADGASKQQRVAPGFRARLPPDHLWSQRFKSNSDYGLESEEGPVQVYVVEKIERPTEN